MDAKYFEEYYSYERNHWFFLARNKIIMNFLRSQLTPNKAYTILNVGVATGQTSELLSEFGKVKSIEYDAACFEFTRKKVENIDIEQGSILELAFDDDQFDIVCAFDVIEHVEDDQLAVNELKRVCKKDGLVYVTVPAFMFLWSQHDVINHHFRRYRKKQLLNLFKDNVSFASYYNTLLFLPAATFRGLNNLVGLVRRSKEESGSDLQLMAKPSFLSKCLYHIFYSETHLLNKKWTLPFGVSLILFWRKPN